MAYTIPQSSSKRAVLKVYLSNGVDEATGYTIPIQISKNGVAFGNPHAGAVNAIEIGSGWYYVDLDSTDTNTLGPLIVRGYVPGIDPLERVYNVDNPHNGGFDGIPNAAANAAGGLPISISGGLDLDDIGIDVDSIETMISSIPTNPVLTSDSRLTNLDATVSSRAVPGSQMDLIDSPNTTALSAIASIIWGFATRVLTAFGFTVSTDKNTEIDSIKSQTDKLQFNASNYVKADAETSVAIADSDKTDIAQRAWDSNYVPVRELTQAYVNEDNEPTVSDSRIRIRRGDTMEFSLLGLGSMLDIDKLYFTVKRSVKDLDAASILQIEKTSGLTVLNGQSQIDGTPGSITVTDTISGNIVVALSDDKTAELIPGQFLYDVELVRTSGILVSTLAAGSFEIEGDITRSV
jgi:hypothetical protein